MKDFFMDEFDKKTNEFLEKSTEQLIERLQELEAKYPGEYRLMVIAVAAASMNFTKSMLRNYHEELLGYLQERD